METTAIICCCFFYEQKISELLERNEDPEVWMRLLWRLGPISIIICRCPVTSEMDRDVDGYADAHIPGIVDFSYTRTSISRSVYSTMQYVDSKRLSWRATDHDGIVPFT